MTHQGSARHATLAATTAQRLPPAAMRRGKRDSVHESRRLGDNANRGSALEGGKKAVK